MTGQSNASNTMPSWQDLNAGLPYFTNLAKPLVLPNGLKMRNRTVMSPMTRTRGTPEDHANETVKEYYAQRAKGECGLIISEGVMVSPQGSEWPHVPGIYSQEHSDAWKPVNQAVHDNGGLIYAQLWHVGRVAHPDLPLQKKFGKPVSAPSAIRARGGNFRSLNNAEYVEAPAHPNPSELVEEFAKAAEYAKAAGFDGVERAAGYLIHQFLDSGANQRTDQWGGSKENRCRFALECIKAAISVYGADSVGLKVSPCCGMNDVGMSLEDTKETYTYLLEQALALNIGHVSLVRYLPFMDAEYDGSMRAGHLAELDALETFGPLVKNHGKTVLFYNGDLKPSDGEQLIVSGKIDAALFGRPFINTPDFAHRIFTGKPLNEDLGFPINFFTLYNWEKDISEGYTSYPDVNVALKSKEVAVAA